MPRAAHRQHPDRARELRERAFAQVEARLAGRVICARCRATAATFAEACTAGLGEGCPGERMLAEARAAAERALS